MTKKILAIDDNNDNLITLSAIIKDSFPDLIFYAALTGKEGIELAISNNPDVILLDIIMPEMDGFDVCSLLKQDERTRDIPVVFLTAMKEDKKSRIKALEVGGEAFLYKPIDEPELAAQIRAMLKIKEFNNRKRDENERLLQMVAERTRELEQSQSETLKLLNELQESTTHFRTLADSGQVLIWTSGIDKKCNYFNRPWLDFTGRTIEQELGDGWAEGVHPDDLQQCVETYVTAFDKREKFSMEYRVRHVSGEYRWIQDDGTPRYNSKGEFIGFIGHCLDISRRKQADEQLMLDEARLESLFKINQYPANSIQDLLDYALDEVISLTGSKIGYIYLYDENKQEFTLNTWSKEVMKQCSVVEPQTVYKLDDTGIWGEAVRQRKPIMVNDFAEPDPLKKGIPEGHSPLHKFLTIPVFSLEHIVAVVGVANKLDDYNDLDIRQMNLMMDGVWKSVLRRKTEEVIAASEARLKRAELASCSGNWEFHLDSQVGYASEGAMSVYEIDSSILDQSLIKAIPLPEYRTMLDEAMKKLIEKNISYDVEFKIKAVKSGKIKDIHSLAIFDKERRIVFGIIQDISDRKRIERSLQQSEARLKTLVQTIPDLIWLKDENGVYLTCNKLFERLYGTPESEIIGKTDYDFVERELADFFRENDQKAIQAGGPTNNEEWLTFADNGQRLMFDTIKTPLYDSDGILIGVLGIARDITERKRNEEALKESENKFRTLFEQMSEGFALHEVIYDTNHKPIDYKVLAVNPAFEKQVGIQSENAKGELATQLYGVSPAPYIDIYAQVAGTGKHQFFQTYFPPLDRHFQISVFSPNPGYFATIFTDITERVKGEEAISNSNDLLSKFILHSPIYTFIKEVTLNESKVVKASDNYIDMIGVPGSQMVGKNMYELFPPEFACKITADDWEVASNDHLIRLDEELNGRYYYTIKYPIKQGNKTLLAGYTIDITERRQAEEALKENETRLRELNATKDKFFSIIAHDLKSPFNSILGLSNLLVEQIQEKNYDGIEMYAGIIQKSSTIVFDLLMNLLEWARLQTGRMEFSPEYVEIGALINEAAELLKDSAREKSITIFREIPRKTIAFGDRTMISAILRNLITNAVKFTRPGGQVVISVEQKTDELQICVHDNGVGIKKAAIEKLFLIGESHTTLGTQNEKGTGLGLILCKEFIEKHGGKIWVESEVGKGSKFYFSVPKP